MPRLSHALAALALLTPLLGCSAHAPAKPSAPAAAPGRPLTLTYLGAAGYQLESGDITLLVDPYFSRPEDLGQPLVPDALAIRAHAPPRAQLILVGHSHADHLLDVPSLALATQAQILGSLSTARVARAAGVGDAQIIPVKGGEDYELGGYSVRVIPSLHSALDHKHTLGGEIPAEPKLPLRFEEYAEGGTFAYLIRLSGRELLVLSTANFIESELAGLRPEIAIVAIGLRQEIHDYTCRLLRTLGYPPVVYPNHFDDWRARARAAPATDDLRAFVAEVAACSPRTRVVLPQPFVANREP